MRSFAFLAAAVAAVSAQSAEVTEVVETAPPMGVYKTKAWEPLVTATTILDTEATATASAVVKRDLVCATQPTGIPHVTVPDSAAGFLADAYYPAQALAAVLPSGYTAAFINTQSSNNADNYMGYTLMSTYDVAGCAKKCDAIDGCSSFNVYFERDPSVNPDSSSCANPPSLTQIKCVWWGGIIDKNTNVNSGQWRNQFEVVIAGSNGYYGKAAAAVAATAVSTAPAAATTVAGTPGSNYAIYFSSDSTVGAFANAAASSSYVDCTTACDNTPTCKAFTYVGATNGAGSGTCWLKTALGSPSKSGSNVISGTKVAAAVVSSSSSSSSTVSTTSSQATTTSTSARTTSTTAAPTTSSTTSTSSSTTTTSAPTTTLATSVKPSSSSTSSTTTSSTTTSAAPSSTAFYIQVDGSNTAADNKWVVAPTAYNNKVTFTTNKASASTFYYDSNGRIVVSGTKLAANVPNTDGSWRNLQFSTIGQNLPYTICSGDDMISCQANNAWQYAGTCASDNYSSLFFGLSGKTPTGCSWIGLYFVAA